MDPIAVALAVQLTHAHTHSALPNAPQIPDRPAPRRRDEVRSTTARWLHLVAERVALRPAEHSRETMTSSSPR